MRLIHFSDTHLGFSEFAQIDPTTGLNAREVDVYKTFEQAIQKIIDLKPDLVIHAGDLFNSSRPSNRAIFKALFSLKRLVDSGIPVVVIAGNHSTPRITSAGSIFETFALFGIHAAHKPEYKTFHIQDTAVHCVPHLPTVDNLTQTLSKVKPDPKFKFNVLVTHAGVHGSGEKYSLGEFNEILVDPEILEGFKAFDYIALGHWHRHLQIASNAFYSGSTERFSFREAGYPKGFLEINLQTRERIFHSVTCRDMVLLDAVKCRGKEAGTIMSELESMLAAAQPLSGKILRITLDGIHPTTWFEIDQRRIREWVATAFETQIEKSFAEAEKEEDSVTSIGGLAAEFSAFIKTADPGGLDRERLQKMGSEYLSRAEEELSQ